MNCYTCLTCRVVLSSNDTQRDHYKQDWHSYNLKRKLAALPPVTNEQYIHVARLHQSSDSDPKSNASATNHTDDLSLYCESCGKQFNNNNAFQQHKESKKHKSLLKNVDKKPAKETVSDKTPDSKTAAKIEDMQDLDDNESDWESVGSDDETVEGEPIAANECLFCDQSSLTVEDNVIHMSVKHSFFIPDAEYVKDMESLLTYLGEKIGLGNLCLWCCHSSKRYRSRRAAQQHMRDKGHTKMCHSGNCFFEYSDFYDYTTSYPDVDASEPHDEEVVIPHLDDHDWQLTLPSGAVVGHRSLFKYYKQNLKPLPENGHKYSKSSALLDNVLSKYRSLGWTGITGEAALQRAKDVKYVQRIQRKYDLKVGMKNNKNLQNHFRSQIGF